MTKPTRLPSNSYVYSRYFRVDSRVKRWGLYVTTCGESIIAPLAPYPPIEHPPSHLFDWPHGRGLSEDQFVYRCAAAGTLESATLAVPAAASAVLPLVTGRVRP